MYIFELSIGSIHIAPTWYWLMYALGFTFCFLFMKKFSGIPEKKLETLLVYVFFGVVLGGRIGYIFLYNPTYFLEHPSEMIAIWKGGMSFHGGLLGTLLAIFLFGRKYGHRFLEITDVLSISIPVAIGLGRIGNYINGELLGFHPYNWPLAIIKNGIWYFPSTLLEFFLEGVLLFLALFGFFKYKKNSLWMIGLQSGLFALWYGMVRIFSEFFRLPDSHIGYLLHTNFLTLGMIYSLPLVVIGLILILRTYRHS